MQRLRRAVVPPVPDELAWTSKLAQRFGVEVSPHPSAVFEELSALAFGGLPFGEVGERAALRAHVPAPPIAPLEAEPPRPRRPGLRLLRYRPLFSGAAVERVPELQFQRPGAEVELSPADASKLGIADGDEVVIGSNGTSRTLRARLNRGLAAGVVRIPEEQAEGLPAHVEVTR